MAGCQYLWHNLNWPLGESHTPRHHHHPLVKPAKVCNLVSCSARPLIMPCHAIISDNQQVGPPAVAARLQTHVSDTCCLLSTRAATARQSWSSRRAGARIFLYCCCAIACKRQSVTVEKEVFGCTLRANECLKNTTSLHGSAGLSRDAKTWHQQATAGSAGTKSRCRRLITAACALGEASGIF